MVLSDRYAPLLYCEMITFMTSVWKGRESSLWGSVGNTAGTHVRLHTEQSDSQSPQKRALLLAWLSINRVKY